MERKLRSMTRQSVASEAWVRRYHSAPGSSVSLVCFPHAGGSASFYYPVSLALSPGVEVLAVQYPGRQDRRKEANIDNMADLADATFRALRPLADRPLAFFGHSMGAVLAFEVALRLERDGVPPLTQLFVSGRRAPSRYQPESLCQQGDDAIKAELRLLSGTDAWILGDPETLEMVMPAIRGDYRAIESYRYKPGQPLSCPVTVLVGDSDPRVNLEEALAWAQHTTGPFDIRVFPGGHFYLVARSQEVVQMLSHELAAARHVDGRTRT
jgi:surfactin synthase thioesterase subunit